MKLYKVVKIAWHDACSEDKWVDLAIAKRQNMEPAVTVGFLIGNHKDRYVVATTVGTTDASGIWTIPKSWVTEIEELHA